MEGQRKRQVVFQVNRGEYDEIAEVSHMNYMTVSEYCRKKVLYVEIENEVIHPNRTNGVKHRGEKDKTIAFYLNEEEFKRFDESVKINEVKMGDFCRFKIFLLPFPYGEEI